jgi:hypothetical protein
LFKGAPHRDPDQPRFKAVGVWHLTQPTGRIQENKLYGIVDVLGAAPEHAFEDAPDAGRMPTIQRGKRRAVSGARRLDKFRIRLGLDRVRKHGVWHGVIKSPNSAKKVQLFEPQSD